MSAEPWKNQERIGGKFGGLRTTVSVGDKSRNKVTYPHSSPNNQWAKNKKERDDFAAYFLPTDDIYGAAGSGDDSIPGLAYFEWLAEHRIGLGPKITRKPADDAIRNRFTVRDLNGKAVIDDEMMDWMEDPNVDFYNTLALALYYERVYGIAFIMKYYTESDRENVDFSTPVPAGKRPIGLQAFPPTLMSPTDTYRTSWLDTNPQKWTLQGGIYNVGEIHHSRVHVIMTRRSATRWRGLSIFEPIWIPIMNYFQAFVYMLKAFSEMGTVIPTWLIDNEMDDLDELWATYATLLDEMKMNGKFIGKKGDEFQFPTTNINQGLTELMEIWKEDIAAGVSFPVNIIWGRISSGGLGQGGYLFNERYYWNEIGNIQASISDDVIRILRDSGFKKIDKNKRIDWNLAITKTDQQRLMDEGMVIQNDVLKEELMQMQLQTNFMAQNMKEGKNLDGSDPNEEKSDKPKKESKKDFIDFIGRRKEIVDKIIAQRRQMFKDMWGDKDS